MEYSSLKAIVFAIGDEILIFYWLQILFNGSLLEPAALGFFLFNYCLIICIADCIYRCNSRYWDRRSILPFNFSEFSIAKI